MRFSSLMACVALAATVSLMSASAHAQDACPTGKQGEWNWTASADGAEVWIENAQWQLQQVEPDPAGEIRFRSKSGMGDGYTHATVSIETFPASLTVKEMDRDINLFDVRSHAYALVLGLDGQQAALVKQENWSGGTFGLFGRGGQFEQPEEVEALNALMADPNPLVVALLTPTGEAGQANITARMVAPGADRAAAWTAAMDQHLQFVRTRATCVN